MSIETGPAAGADLAFGVALDFPCPLALAFGLGFAAAADAGGRLSDECPPTGCPCHPACRLSAVAVQMLQIEMVSKKKLCPPQ